jgi:hypothetical protein
VIETVDLDVDVKTDESTVLETIEVRATTP